MGGAPRILKRGTPGPTLGPADADALVAEARVRSCEIVAAAEAEAERLRATARDEVAQVRAEAVADGLAEGRGRAAALLALVAQAREARLAELEAVAMDAAVEIARRILGRELAAAPQTVVEIARGALRAAAGCGDLALRIAPADGPSIRGAEDALRTLLDGGGLGVVEDPALERGDVVVEASRGRVDARIETQLDTLRRALADPP